MLIHEPRAAVAVSGGARGGRGLDWTAKNWLLDRSAAGCFSHESEPDLAALVSDFLESSSAGAESWLSSDGDSCYYDLADKILMYKHSCDQFESDLTMVVHSLILSITDTCQSCKPETCNASCIRFCLMKLLQSSGYDAAICTAKWQGYGKIPGGEHEYIDVISDQNGKSERYIIDIDFRSHFEIARAVKSYAIALDSLPAVYVGTTARLKMFLSTMVEAAKDSLKQNSMPLPPWRSLAYLETKWESPSQRAVNFNGESSTGNPSCSHLHCSELLRRIKLSIGCNSRWKE
nr:uncharacterized protein LOC109192743 [Ipomoea trifida]